ncbi:glycosyltransferase family 4 protein [Cephaloticoccus capnophilus]|uniref:glycosyltransferase family 4 protein n=1 Tax=Cephaloticoccus capnophilus TaxID=1548208 RepID=UPI000839ADB3|nr:glycosyltransferase family 4 protein [Cephaloticoccus capnophilus]
MTSKLGSYKSDKLRLAIVVSHPIQYYSPWFRKIAGEPSLHLRVFYLDDQGQRKTQDREFGKSFSWDVNLLSGYDYEFIPNAAKHPGTHHFWGLRNPGLHKAICDYSPDALLIFTYPHWSLLNLILRRPAPLIFRGDSTLLRPHPIKGLKRLILRFIYSRCAAFLPVGQANAAYFRHCSVPQKKLFPAPHCVNVEHFTPTPDHLENASELRSSLSIPADATVLLFAGKFIPQKRPDLLLSAFLPIALEFPSAHLVFSGDGALLPKLRETLSTAEKLIRQRVHFLPFANQSAMPARYLLGDCLILPSESETWGLAVNEAMHLGRPAIVSDRVGCHPDLIQHGKTGWVFHSGAKEALTETLRNVLSLSRAELAEKGRAAQAHAASFNYDNATAGLLAALKSLP